MKLGPLIREARTGAGLSLAELGRRVRCSSGYLCRIEQGDRSRRPSTHLLVRLASALRLKVDVVFVAAGRVPDDLVKFLLSTPEALAELRRMQQEAA